MIAEVPIAQKVSTIGISTEHPDLSTLRSNWLLALERDLTDVFLKEPNAEYLQSASQRLSSLGFAKGKFEYLLERAERSSVESGTVDVLLMCEAIHWTEIPTAVSEFARQLKSGGTLCILFYAPAVILGNDNAQKVWEVIFENIAEETIKEPAREKVYTRAVRNIATGLDNVAFDEDVWEGGVERRFTNLEGDRRNISKRFVAIDAGIEEDRLGASDEKIWIEDDKDWETYGCDLEWIKRAFLSFLRV